MPENGRWNLVRLLKGYESDNMRPLVNIRDVSKKPLHKIR